MSGLSTSTLGCARTILVAPEPHLWGRSSHTGTHVFNIHVNVSTMLLLKQVSIETIYSHTQKGSERGLAPGRVYGKVWDVCTPLSTDSALPKSKLFKSITDDISNDKFKKINFLDLVRGVYEASNIESFKDYYNTSTTTQLKEAHSFEINGKRIKIHEVKNTRKKERLYIYIGEIEKRKRCILLLAIHKRDETTPGNVKSYCEDQVKQFLRSNQASKS